MDENELEELRRSVGDIDQNLVSLLEKRLQVSQSMTQRQLKAHTPVYDAAREEKNIHDLSELLDHMKYQMYDNPIFAIPSESEVWFFLAEKRNMTLNDFISSVLAPLSGELPKAEGAAIAG